MDHRMPKWPSWVVIIATVCLAFFVMIMVTSCSVTKDKQWRAIDESKSDTASIRTGLSSSKSEGGSNKEAIKYEREETRTPIILQVDSGKRDSAGAPIINLYPTHQTVIRETGSVDRASDYHKSDSTRIDRLEQSLTTLIYSLEEKSKQKDTTTPWYVWVVIALLGSQILTNIFSTLKNRSLGKT